MENKEIFSGFLKDDDLWLERLNELEKYGEVEKISGDFKFNRCVICNGPWIAHDNIEDEAKCEKIKKRGEKIKEEEIQVIENWIKDIPLFKIKLAEIDRRHRACCCDKCEKFSKVEAHTKTT